MGRENLKKDKQKTAPTSVKKKIKKDRLKPKHTKKAAAEAVKLEKRKEHKEKVKAQEKRKEAVEEEELKIEKELFDKQGYYVGPTTEAEGISESDQAILQQFSSAEGSLADMIMKKLHEKEATMPKPETEQIEEEEELQQKIKDVYTSIGEQLQKYTSGKIPKPFKVIPQYESWQKLIKLTNPDNWSPQAMYQAVKVFSGTMSPKMFESFLKNTLLPAIKEDISQRKKLNVHYYQSLKKALFKPAAFFKGIIFPLAKNATAKEAIIVGSILNKV